jgi:hypothetical protein
LKTTLLVLEGIFFLIMLPIALACICIELLIKIPLSIIFGTRTVTSYFAKAYVCWSKDLNRKIDAYEKEHPKREDSK